MRRAALIEREDTDTVTEIYNCLEGDDEAQLAIMAIADGKKGKALFAAYRASLHRRIFGAKQATTDDP